MKRLLFCIISALAAGLLSVSAQETVWHNPLVSGNNIHGRGFAIDNYTRLPDDAQGKVRGDVWGLSRNSAGLWIAFTTDSPDITVQYTVAGGHSMPHMPATGVSGVDLYNGRGERCFGSYSFGTPVTYTYKGLPDTLPTGNGGGSYTLYLPLYNTVTGMKVGVRKGSSFTFTPSTSEQLPVVVYGTSIAQGACASRPGMAWTNILHRKLGMPVVNLGFSGNGRLEPEVIDYVTAIPAALYVVDCMPNMYVSEDSIYRLVMNAVHQFRQARPEVPILLVEHPGYSDRATNAIRRSEDERVDRAQQKAYADLRREGVKGLYYLSREELGMPADGMVDHIHPSDFGMEAYAKAYQKVIGKILKNKR